MFLNFNFFVVDAYIGSIKTIYKNILFYLAWYGISVLLSMFFFYGLLWYIDVLHIQNYHSFVPIIKKQLSFFVYGFDYNLQDIKSFNFYNFLKLIFTADLVNHNLEIMSLKEYCNIILFPKKIVVIPVCMIWISSIMTMSIGYIKTALRFQSGKKATLSDMYQYVYLLPRYFLAKTIVFLVCFIGIFFSSIIGFFVLIISEENTQKEFAVTGIIFAIIVLLGLFLVTFFYQRLRFVKYFIIDQETSVFKAISLSWRMTQGNVLSLSLFSLIATTIGVLHPMSGLFIMMSSWLNQQAEVSLYRQMTASENN